MEKPNLTVDNDMVVTVDYILTLDNDEVARLLKDAATAPVIGRGHQPPPLAATRSS